MNIYITPEEYAEAEKHGICRDTLDRRIKTYGWDRKRALTEKVRKKKVNSLKEYFDKAAANGICKTTFLRRIYCQGWSHERAATQPTDLKHRRKDLK